MPKLPIFQNQVIWTRFFSTAGWLGGIFYPNEVLKTAKMTS